MPGNGYTGAHSWYQEYYGTPNAEVMLGVADTANKFYIEVHQYFDANSSGIYNDDCVNAAVGSQRLTEFTGWLKEHNLKGFLGEIGIINTPNCNGAITNALQYMQDNNDVWVGWAYWAAGPWWGDYALSIEPNDDGSDKAIMSQITPFLP